MKESDIQKIASSVIGQLTSGIGEPVIKGCGSASNPTGYGCQTSPFSCSSYECGGAGMFSCVLVFFNCSISFVCYEGSWFYCTEDFSWDDCNFSCWENYTWGK